MRWCVVDDLPCLQGGLHLILVLGALLVWEQLDLAPCYFVGPHPTPPRYLGAHQRKGPSTSPGQPELGLSLQQELIRFALNPCTASGWVLLPQVTARPMLTVALSISPSSSDTGRHTKGGCFSVTSAPTPHPGLCQSSSPFRLPRLRSSWRLSLWSCPAWMATTSASLPTGRRARARRIPWR